MKPRRRAGKERRSEHRLSFEGVIPGRLTHEAKELSFRAFDVSRKGLGLYLSPCPDEGEELVLDLGARDVKPLRFTLRHIYRSENPDETMQRCGVELLENERSLEDLIQILSRYNA